MTSFMRLLRSTAQKHGLCVLVSIHSFLRLCPCPIWAPRRVEMACCVDERYPGPMYTGTQRRDGSGASGSRGVLHISDRRNGVACSPAGARPRTADIARTPLARIGNRGALYVSDTARESAGDLSFDKWTPTLLSESSMSLMFVSCVCRTNMTPDQIQETLAFFWEMTLEDTVRYLFVPFIRIGL